MGFWVYLLKCSDGTLYAGSTTDLERRINEHNSDKHGAKYTAGRRPVALLQAWEVKDWSSALRLERGIKKCSRTRKLRLVSGEVVMEGLCGELDINILSISVNIND